jgi:hypothetical protein
MRNETLELAVLLRTRSPMQKITTFGALCVLLLGCGGSSTEILLGNAVALGVHEAPSGRRLVEVKIGLRACRPAKVAIAWGGPGPTSIVAHRTVEACVTA